MKFRTPQISLYVENLEVSREFYEMLGFKVQYEAKVHNELVHYEMMLDSFKLGIATKESASLMHGLKPGSNSGCEIVLWTEDTDGAVQFLRDRQVEVISEPHNFLDDTLRSGWVCDPDGNPIHIVSRNSNK